MSNKAWNPYQDFSVVHTPEMFFGRTTLLRRIYSSIASKQCLSLVGTRHIGKSSLMAHLCLPETQQRFSYELPGFIFIQLDLRTYRQKSSEHFFASVSEHILSSCRGVSLSLSFQKGADLFSNLLRQLSERGVHIVLLFDAFDNIVHNEQFDISFFSFLRAQVPRVSYITASVAPLADICRKDVKESPFFNIFGPQEIGPLTPDEAYNLTTVPAQEAGYPFSDAEVKWILSRAGRHPFFIQRVCHWLLEEKYLQDGSTYDLKHAEQQAYKELQPHFASLWNELNDVQRNTLEAQIQGHETQQKIPLELSESILFRQFVYETRDIQFAEITTHMTVEDIENLLDNLDDLQALGESKMRRFRIVCTRLKNSSTSETGRVIRDILKQAFERTRGSGAFRQESSDDWRFYNILYYRYFGSHSHRKLTNDQLAARLDYNSTRNYYRDRKKAISALLHEILEMESAFSTQ